jgi:hypothetical protein
MSHLQGLDSALNEMIDCQPRSSCSIDEEGPRSRSHLPHPDDLKDKSQKYLSDRFLPVRKMPCSAKELFNDKVEWLEDEEN